MRKVDYIILICTAAVLVLASFMIAKPSANIGSSPCRLLTSCDTISMNSIIAVRNATGNYTIGNVCASLGYADSASCARYCGCTLNGTSTALSSQPLKAYTDTPVGEGAFIVRNVK